MDDFHFRIFQQPVKKLTVLIRTDRAGLWDLPRRIVEIINFLNRKLTVKHSPIGKIDAERYHRNIKLFQHGNRDVRTALSCNDCFHQKAPHLLSTLILLVYKVRTSN